uniref:DNA-directed DNA polymerase n=1 Tax=Tanacetum cinerariifolium TaxID=118510 RepID=A0A6L2NPT2_TANCI|nr:DNA-directed DNA polymerase [Tanacetum cinerariifolium]
MQRTWIERCETQRRENKEMRDRDTHPYNHHYGSSYFSLFSRPHNHPIQKKSNTTTFRTIKCMSQPQDDIKPSSAPKVSTQFSDLLSFSGPAPERINGGVRAESKSNGLMTSDAELWNGRFAILGLVGLAFTEFVQDSSEAYIVRKLCASVGSFSDPKGLKGLAYFLDYKKKTATFAEMDGLFPVLEMDEDELVPIILGRPFLATARAVIYVHEGKLSLRVGDEILTFNFGKSMKSKHSRDDYIKWFEEEEEGYSNKVQAVSFYPREKPIEPLEWKALENRLKPSSVKPPKLELKELLKKLEYAFLLENDQLPVVISSALSAIIKVRLLEVLKNHKGAIAWSIADIERIDSYFCTHKILMKDEFKPSVQPQRQVDPNIKKVVVLKKGGMTVIKNEKNELIPQRTVTG